VGFGLRTVPLALGVGPGLMVGAVAQPQAVSVRRLWLPIFAIVAVLAYPPQAGAVHFGAGISAASRESAGDSALWRAGGGGDTQGPPDIHGPGKKAVRFSNETVRLIPTALQDRLAGAVLECRREGPTGKGAVQSVVFSEDGTAVELGGQSCDMEKFSMRQYRRRRAHSRIVGLTLFPRKRGLPPSALFTVVPIEKGDEIPPRFWLTWPDGQRGECTDVEQFLQDIKAFNGKKFECSRDTFSGLMGMWTETVELQDDQVLLTKAMLPTERYPLPDVAAQYEPLSHGLKLGGSRIFYPERGILAWVSGDGTMLHAACRVKSSD